MADAVAVGMIFLAFWAFCFIFWNMANYNLHHWPETIEPYMLDGVMWWAQWGLWIPTVVTILLVIVLILGAVARSVGRSNARRQSAVEEWRQERVRRMMDMDSSDVETAYRRELREQGDFR